MNPNKPDAAAQEKKIGDPSPQAIDYAKRLIALKWTKETNVDTIAGTWQAGYMAAQLDAQSSQSGKERAALEKIVADMVASIKSGDNVVFDKGFSELFAASVVDEILKAQAISGSNDDDKQTKNT